MNVTIVGPGALGCLFAARLAIAGNTVWLYDRDKARAAYIGDQGIVLQTSTGEQRVPILCTADSRVIGRTDLIVLCVKSHDLAMALRQLRPLLTDDALLIALQNGIGHHGAMQAAGRAFAVGVTAQGGTLAGIGKVVHGGSGQTVLGYLSEVSKQKLTLLHSVAELFNAADLPTVVSGKILNAIWDKLVVNVGINALTAIHDCRNGELLADPLLISEQRAAVQEAANVAAAKGIILSGDPEEITAKVCVATANNVSSMLQDIRKGRRTEIDAINGSIVRAGKRLGIATPVNEKLVAAVKAIELKVARANNN
nr:2-dehydropantoate 2-reductase [Desulfobulbaceae bacterium]